MAEKRDYYEVLGVSKTATDAEIKKAFRQQAKKYHPDIHPGDKECEEKFKEAQEAYAVLSDPDKRRQYDQFGHAAFDGTGGGAGGFDFSGMDMGDIFGDIFGDFFGGGRSSGRRNGPAQGANVRLSVRISFEEAIFGCTKELEFNYKETCSTCGGNGAKPGTSPETCTQCNGTGTVIITPFTCSNHRLMGKLRNDFCIWFSTIVLSTITHTCGIYNTAFLFTGCYRCRFHSFHYTLVNLLGTFATCHLIRTGLMVFTPRKW